MTDVSTTWAVVIFRVKTTGLHPDDHAKQMTDTPGLKPYAKVIFLLINKKKTVLHVHNPR